MQSGVRKEVREHRGMMRQAAKAATHDVVQVVDGVGERVQHVLLHPLIALFLRIELRCVAWQPSEREVVGMAVEVEPTRARNV